jgi:hypothetical protein
VILGANIYDGVVIDQRLTSPEVLAKAAKELSAVGRHAKG